MASAFMPEAGQFTDRTEPLEEILPIASARDLFEQLAESSAAEKMLCVMDDFLRPLEPPDNGEKVLHQLGLNRSSLDEFSKDVGLSTRQLRRICLDRAGVSPKFLIRILRLRDAAERISQIAAAMTPPNWAEFALSCGYYDQAHFIRDFQQFTGFTPGRYLQSFAEPGS
jgi:AraC-like DNA-binding protein